MSERLTLSRGVCSRIGGFAEIGVGNLIFRSAAVNVLNSDLPLPLRILVAAPLIAGTVYFTMEGIVDIALGTHHYLTLQVYRRLARSESTKQSIKADIEYMLTHKNDRIGIRFPFG